MFDAVLESPRYRETNGITEVAFLDDGKSSDGLPAPIAAPVVGFQPHPVTWVCVP